MLSCLRTGRPRRIAAVLLASVSLAASAGVGSIFLTTAVDTWASIAAAGPASPADGILLMTGLGGALLSLWLGLGTALSALAALPGSLGRLCQQAANRVAPAAVRKAIALILGTTLTAALVPGTTVAGVGPNAPRPTTLAAGLHGPNELAEAAPDASFRSLREPPPSTEVNDAAPAPSWSPFSARPAPEGRPAPGSRPATEANRLAVHRGDTLWSIAAHHLGPSATAAAIDVEWRRWFAANRDVIGEDANLILPGQLLRQPPTDAGS